MKKIVIIVFCLVLVVGIVCISMAKTGNSKSIQSQDTLSMTIDDYIKVYQQDTDALLLDVRTPDEVKEGKIPGSINVPLDSLENATFDKNITIYVYCKGGKRSQAAYTLLKNKGYNVINIGGIMDYSGHLE